MGKGAKSFIAVKRGAEGPRIYSSWAEAQPHVNGFSHAIYKGFNSYGEAKNFAFGNKPASWDTLVHRPHNAGVNVKYHREQTIQVYATPQYYAYTHHVRETQEVSYSHPHSNPYSYRRNKNRALTGRRALTVQASADNKFADYKPKLAIYFPGQGAQSVGMAKDLIASTPKAKELFDKASQILGYDLAKLCAEGPAEKLNSTAVSQPAIYVSSLAAIEKLRAEKGDDFINSVDVVAGLSLGEYTALTFAGAMTFEDGLKLVKLRGESMQAAADATPSGMASIIGLDVEKTQALVDAANAEVDASEKVRIANFLCPGNYAVSGGLKGIAAVEAKAKSFGARMAVRLAVAGAFHTDYMQPAVSKLEAALAATNIVAPRIPVISNVDVAPHSDPAVIKAILAKQVVGPVQWEKTIKTLLEKGLAESYEVGPGKVISGIVKRIDKAAKIETYTV